MLPGQEVCAGKEGEPQLNGYTRVPGRGEARVPHVGGAVPAPLPPCYCSHAVSLCCVPLLVTPSCIPPAMPPCCKGKNLGTLQLNHRAVKLHSQVTWDFSLYCHILYYMYLCQKYAREYQIHVMCRSIDSAVIFEGWRKRVTQPR